MLFSKRMELEREYYKWIEDNREKFAIQDCPSNVIAFLDSRGLLAIPNSHEKDLENPTIIKYVDSPCNLTMICPFGKMSKVGSYGCTECKFFIRHDYTRNIVVCGGKNE